MKLIKTLPAAFAIALLAGCASQRSEDITGGEAAQKDGGSCCKAEGAKASCCDGAKVEKMTEAEKAAQKN